MVSYDFYQGDYRGISIPRLNFARFAARAAQQIEHYKRIYTVYGSETDENMAICAIADALYYFELASNGGLPTSARVGNVSTSYSTPNISPAAQEAEMYRCARLYLDIYRGCD